MPGRLNIYPCPGTDNVSARILGRRTKKRPMRFEPRALQRVSPVQARIAVVSLLGSRSFVWGDIQGMRGHKKVLVCI
jgi:hypothetical protein